MNEQRQLIPDLLPRSKGHALELGCTCEWWGRGAIISFDRACPIIDRHRGVPWDVNQLTLEVAS